MEHHLYTSLVTKDNIGFQTFAKSPGFDTSLIPNLEGRYGFYGTAPEHIPPEGILSFISLPKRRYAAYKIYEHGMDASGARRNFFTHSIVLTRDELDKMGGDPFRLEDEGLFIKPTHNPRGLTEAEASKFHLSSLEAPGKSFAAEEKSLRTLAAMEPTKRNLLLNSTLCPRLAYLGGTVTPEQLRAVRYVVPELYRRHLSFTGLATGVPHEKTQLTLMPEDCLPRLSEVPDSIAASMKWLSFSGGEPTAYATKMSKLLGVGNFADIKKIVQTAQAGSIDVFEKDALKLIEAAVPKIATWAGRV